MTTKGLDASAGAREDYVRRGRARLAGLLKSVDFDAPRWDVSVLATRNGAKVQVLYFTLHGDLTAVLPVMYAEVVKAWVVVAGGSPSRMHWRVNAARWLWRGVAQRLGEDAATSFTWKDLREADLRAAEQLMIADQLSPRTINKTATTMSDLVRQLGILGIGPTISYQPITPRQGDSNVHRVDDPVTRAQGVLSSAAQAALADVFHRATTVADKFWSSVMALLLATGIRWNEAVTLPLECLVEESVGMRDVTGARVVRKVTYLLRHKSKTKRGGGSGRTVLERVPLTETQAELARLAVDRLRGICAEARALAARLEASEPQWRLASDTRASSAGAYLYQDEIVRALECSGSNADFILRQIGEPDPHHSGPGMPPRRVTLERFEEYMTSRQDWGALWTVKPGGGQRGQRASESLLCIRANELHAVKSAIPIIVPPSHAQLERWLTGVDDFPSVFTRHEMEHGVRHREPDGSLVKIDSHMCRRFFVTTGLTAGATTVDIARWQGREHIGDLAAYDGRSMLERVMAVRNAIRTGRLQGQVAQTYVQLAASVRDEWLEGQVQAMHVTPYGLCIHDFSATPCPLALNCVKGCKDYLHDPNNEQERQSLIQLRRRTAEVMERMEAEGNVAPAWMDEQRTTLAGLDHILATGVPEDGAYAAPYAGRDTRYRDAAESEA